jgi:uncharacterized membrane protein YozB (DUF420 family)
MELTRGAPGFLGTGADLVADITLLAYILLIVPGMLAGFFFARRKMYEPAHKYTMTLIMMVNWVLIIFVMSVSYSRGVAPSVPAGLPQPVILFPTIHLVTGAIAQLLATYLVIRMWFEDVLPAALKVKRIKRYMRFTLAMWLTTALLGVVIYLFWYVLPASGTGDAGDPAATPDLNALVTPDLDAIVTPDLDALPMVTPELDQTQQALIQSMEATTRALMALESGAPASTPEVAETPEVAATPEVGG